VPWTNTIIVPRRGIISAILTCVVPKDETKVYHEVHVGVYGVLADFVKGVFIWARADVPRIYDEEVGVSFHLIYQKLRFARSVSTESNSEKEFFVGRIRFHRGINIDLR